MLLVQGDLKLIFQNAHSLVGGPPWIIRRYTGTDGSFQTFYAKSWRALPEHYHETFCTRDALENPLKIPGPAQRWIETTMTIDAETGCDGLHASIQGRVTRPHVPAAGAASAVS